MQNLLSALLIAFLLSSCAGETKKSESAAKPEIDQEAVNMITVRGTIRYKNLEGGFWALDGDDGNKYMPSGLDKALRIDGMVIEVKGVIEEDVVTFQQYGKTLKIKQSRMIDDSNAKVLNSY